MDRHATLLSTDGCSQLNFCQLKLQCYLSEGVQCDDTAVCHIANVNFIISFILHGVNFVIASLQEQIWPFSRPHSSLQEEHMLGNIIRIFACENDCSVTIYWRPLRCSCLLCRFMLYKMVLPFQSVDEILKCDRWKQSLVAERFPKKTRQVCSVMLALMEKRLVFAGYRERPLWISKEMLGHRLLGFRDYWVGQELKFLNLLPSESVNYCDYGEMLCSS